MCVGIHYCFRLDSHRNSKFEFPPFTVGLSVEIHLWAMSFSSKYNIATRLKCLLSTLSVAGLKFDKFIKFIEHKLVIILTRID